jgi:hypothetical protein
MRANGGFRFSGLWSWQDERRGAEMKTSWSPFGRFLLDRRRAAGFDVPSELARKLRPDLEWRQILALSRVIERLEISGRGPAPLVDKIVAALEISPDELAAAHAEEAAWREARAAENRRLVAQPVELDESPYFVIRVMAAVYLRVPLPEPLASDLRTAARAVTQGGKVAGRWEDLADAGAAVEAWWRDILLARRMPYPACLVLDSHRRVEFDGRGRVVSGGIVATVVGGLPYTRIGRRRVQFGIEPRKPFHVLPAPRKGRPDGQPSGGPPDSHPDSDPRASRRDRREG